MPERALLLIDGGYLDYLQRSFGSPRIDYGKMALAICERFGYAMLRCVYVNCLPYLSQNPAPEEQEAYNRKQAFFDRLSKLDRFQVKLGRLAFRGVDEKTGKPVLEQKQVDVLLASEMVYNAARRSVDAIVLLSGDGDFVPAVDLVKREGLTLALAHGSRSGVDTVHDSLWNAADTRMVVDMEFFKPLLRE